MQREILLGYLPDNIGADTRDRTGHLHITNVLLSVLELVARKMSSTMVVGESGL